MMWIALAILIGPSLAVALSGAGRDDERVRRTDEDAKKCQAMVRNEIAGIKINPVTQELTFESVA